MFSPRLFSALLLSLSVIGAHARCANSEQVNPYKIQAITRLPLESLFAVSTSLSSKKQEQLLSAPSSMSVFTRRELRDMGVDSLESLLNFVPGFISSREIVFNQGEMVAARGRTTPQASYNLLVMVDGQRLNNDRSGGAFALNRFITLDNVEQVEIVRGPGSALYGTNAFSGTINLITSKKRNNLVLGTGSADGHKVSMQVADVWNDWEFNAFAAYFSDRGETYPLADGTSTRDPRSGADVNLGLCRDTLRLGLRHNRREVEDFYSYEYIGNGVNRNTSTQTSVALDYRLWEDLDSRLDLRLSHMWMQIDGDTQIIDAATMATLPTTALTAAPLIYANYGEEQETYLGLDWHQYLSRQHEIFAGLEWRRAIVDEDYKSYNYDYSALTGWQPGDAPITHYPLGSWPTYPNSRTGARAIWGVYFQDNYRFNKQWSSTVGARYDRYSDFGGTLSPRLALIYSPKQTSALKLLYGEAFRAPSVRQTSAIPVGNPDLQPEKVKTLELVWIQHHQYWEGALTYFHSRYTNLIDTLLFDTEMMERRFVNLPGEQTTSGLELEGGLKLGRYWHLRLAYTYLIDLEQEPRRFPRQTFSMIANYRQGNWNLNLNAYYHDAVEQETLGDYNELDAYWVANAALRYRINKQLSLLGKISNLLDEDYASPSKMVVLSDGVPNRGRGYFAGLEFTF